jgi:hypothetical protein
MAKARVKTGAKKPSAKKSATSKKATAQRAKPIAQAKAKPKLSKGKPPSKGRPTALKIPTMRRPDPNLPPEAETITIISGEIQHLTEFLSNYAAHLRALDRMRHNGVGIHRQGFIERALLLAQENPEYLPHWLSVQKFETDNDLFVSLRSLAAAIKQLQELSWNITVEAADMAFTDALEFYSQVQDAANRRVDAAEALYEDLHPFFRRGPLETEEPTQKKAKRDFNAVLKGKKEGKVGAKNIKPKMTGGKREIIDETFKDSASFKETEEGDIEG